MDSNISYLYLITPACITKIMNTLYGKNNISPNSRNAWLTLIEKDMDTVIHINLWRYPPESLDEDPDLTYIFKIFPNT